MPVLVVKALGTLCRITPEYGDRVRQTTRGPEPRARVRMERVEEDIIDGASSDIETDLD